MPSFHLLQADFLVGCFLTMNMAMIHSSETLVQIWTAWCYIPEDGSIHNYCCENLKYYLLLHSHQIWACAYSLLTHPMDLGLTFITNSNKFHCFYTIWSDTSIFRSFDIQLDIIPKYAKYLSGVGINAVLGEFPFTLYTVICQQYKEQSTLNSWLSGIMVGMEITINRKPG
jgi:hypothetical protein